MGEKLQVDTAVISAAATQTESVRSRLESAKADANSLESMIPVPDLRRTVVDFASDWEIGRTKMVEEIGQLKEQLAAVSDAFENADAELTSRITQNL